MEQVVTLTGVEEKARGENDSGPWVLRLFSTAGGTKFQTFDDELGQSALGFIGKSSTIEYEVEDREYTITKGPKAGQTATAQNNVIKSIREAGAAEVAAQPAQEPQQSGSRSEYQRSKEEVRRTAAVQTAATLVASPEWTGDRDIPTLVALAEMIAVYAEQGAEAFATADSGIQY